MIKTNYNSNDENEKNENIRLQKIKWSPKLEELLNSWADISLCNKWLHESAYRKYKKINYIYSIPVIILSTLSGTINVGMAGLVTGEYSSMSQIIIGVISIITGLISTLQSFFRYAQTSESHLNAYMGWSRLHRNILIELNLQRRYRKNPGDFVKVCRSEYDRLMEQSPLVPPDIIKKFKEKYGDSNKNGGLIIPDNIDNIRHVEIYKDPDISYELEKDKISSQSFHKKPNISTKYEFKPNIYEEIPIKCENSLFKTNNIHEEIKNEFNINVKDIISKLEKDVKIKPENVDIKIENNES